MDLKMKDKIKSGFVIKLSSETAQKLAEEKLQEHKKSDDNIPTKEDKDTADEQVTQNVTITPDDKRSLELSTEGQISTAHAKDLEKGNEKQSKQQSVDESTVEPSSGTIQTSSKLDESASNAWGEYAPYITYEGEQAIYTDPSNNQKYNWSKETNAWDPVKGQTEVPGRVYSYEDDTHTYTEVDGSKFFWDVDKKAWIPKVDDDFLALYQMSYGFVDNTAKDTESKEEIKKKEALKKAEAVAGAKRKNEPQWFEPSEETNTKVYVSNLPLDLTEEEFVNLMQKCGLVERDPSSQKMKVKLYKDKEQDCFKGDALCTYIKIESVDLALKLLDGYDFKGNKIKVERAHFQLKGEYNPALKPKKKKKKELEKIKKMQQKLFDWRPEKFIGERSKHERVVIIKNLFHPSDFDKEVQLILDYQQDLREECSKVGEVRKVVLYDRHPEGVAQVTMKEPEMADAAVQLINGRWFGKRQIIAEIWDGKTKYKIAETDADLSKRVDKWEKFLEGKEEDKGTSQSKDKSEATGTSKAPGTSEDKGTPEAEGTSEDKGTPEAEGTSEDKGVIEAEGSMEVEKAETVSRDSSEIKKEDRV